MVASEGLRCEDGEAVTKTVWGLSKESAFILGLIFSGAALVAISARSQDGAWSICCFIPVSVFFALIWWHLGEQDRVTRRNVILQKKEVEDRR